MTHPDRGAFLGWFPNLPIHFAEKMDLALATYREWNNRINVISRRDIDALEIHHFAHSLSISLFHAFSPNERCLDVGTGGGFPGIPLAMLFPETQFILVDSVGKKLKVIHAVCEALQIKNVELLHDRIENRFIPADTITGRAVMPLSHFTALVGKNLNSNPQAAICYLSGSQQEQPAKPWKSQIIPLHSHLTHPYFEGKALFKIQRSL